MFGVRFFYFQVTVKTDDMDLAGDIIQALASFLGIEVDMPKISNLHLMSSIGLCVLHLTLEDSILPFVYSVTLTTDECGKSKCHTSL